MALRGFTSLLHGCEARQLCFADSVQTPQMPEDFLCKARGRILRIVFNFDFEVEVGSAHLLSW